MTAIDKVNINMSYHRWCFLHEQQIHAKKWKVREHNLTEQISHYAPKSTQCISCCQTRLFLPVAFVFVPRETQRYDSLFTSFTERDVIRLERYDAKSSINGFLSKLYDCIFLICMKATSYILSLGLHFSLCCLHGSLIMLYILPYCHMTDIKSKLLDTAYKHQCSLLFRKEISAHPKILVRFISGPIFL